MKYIVTKDEQGKEEIFIFPVAVHHDVMYNAVGRLKNQSHGSWERVDREFDQAWEALRSVFPVAASEYESKYQQNQTSGRGYIKWAPDEGQMWTSVTKVWHEFMLEFKDYEDLRVHLSGAGIFIPDIAKSPVDDELDLELTSFEEATVSDAREFISLLDKSQKLSMEILDLQGQAQEKLELLDDINQKKERLRKLLNIGEGE